MNNYNKIKNVMKKAYEDVEPSQQLQDKVLDTYKQSQENFGIEVEKNDKKFSNLFQVKHLVIAGSLVLIVVVASTVFLIGGGDKAVALDEVEKLIEESSQYTDIGFANEVIENVDENMDTLAMLAEETNNQDEGTTTKDDTNVDANIQELDDVLNSLDALDEIDEILDDDILDDEIFS